MAKALPDEFPPAEKSYSLYEGIEYQGFWDDPDLLRQDALEQHILADILPGSGRRILDLGGGYGRLAPCYVDRFEQVVLCDGSISLLRDARKTLGDRVVLVASDITRLPFMASSFDCVLTIRVLQHVHDLRAALLEARRVIAEEGQFVFSYHNKRNAKRLLPYFAARGDANPFSWESTEPMPTLISRHPHVVEALLHESGFSPPEYQGTAIVKSLARVSDRLGRRAPAGAGWASLMGRWRLAPWLIGSSFARDADLLREADAVTDLLICPVCRGTLAFLSEAAECSYCHRSFPIEDGIFDFRS